MNAESKRDLYITCKDHTVSGEQFQLLLDDELNMLVTSPKPDLNVLGTYYESEDYISHTDSKRSLFERAYHFVKGIALKQKVKRIEQAQPQKGKLLDIGAGTGDFLLTAKNHGWDVLGSEPNEEARALAKEKGISLLENLETLPADSFDVITMWHVLEHVYDLNEQISELKRLLKPGGSLFVAVPNYESYDATYYKEFWAAYDVPRHLWHFSKRSIQKLFEVQNMKVVKILPMRFDAFYVSLLSEKYKTGRMNPITAFFIGLRSNLKAKRTKNHSSLIYCIENGEN